MRISSDFVAPGCRARRAAFTCALAAAYTFKRPQKTVTFSVPFMEKPQGKQIGGKEQGGALG